MNKTILTICVFQLMAQMLFAQEKLITYDEAIKTAVEQNVILQQQRNLLKVNKVEKQQSIASFLPFIDANGSGDRTKGRQWSNEESAMVNTSIERANLNIGANLTIFNGFRNVYRLKQSDKLMLAQKEHIEQRVQDIIFQTSQQFLQVLLDKELLVIAEKDYEIQKKLYGQLEVYVKVGTRTSTELLSQEAQMETSGVNVLSRQNQLRADKASLAKLLSLETNKGFDIVTPLWKVDSILILQKEPDYLLQMAIKNRPEIKQSLLEEKAALFGMRSSMSGYFPRINLFYNYGSYFSSSNRRLNPVDNEYYNVSFSDQLFKENFSNRYGLSLRIPIFSRMETRASVISSKIAYENSKLSYKDMEMQITIDVQNAIQDFISYKRSYSAHITNAKAAKNAYDKQSELYRLGEGDLIDLNIESQRSLLPASERVQAKYTLMFQQIVLDYYVGILGLN